MAYIRVETVTSMFVDAPHDAHDPETKMRIEMDITMFRFPCACMILKT